MMKPKPRPLTRALLSTTLTLALPASVQAVTPASFTHTTEADFADGDAYGTVVTNLGDIKLASDTAPIPGLPDDVAVIHDAEQIGGDLYVATGPTARVYKLGNEGFEAVAEFEGEQVFALDQWGGGLLIAVSSTDDCRLVTLNGETQSVAARFEGASYIWDLMAGGLEVFAATGPQGKVFYASLDPDGSVVQGAAILHTPQSNVLSLARGVDGSVFAGTDTDGLVYRLTPSAEGEDWDPFVVYDAPEAEIAALLVTDDGMLYAGTAAVDQAKPGRLTQPNKAEEGRPDAPELDMGPKPEQLAQPADAAAVGGSDPDTPGQPKAAAEGESEAAVDAGQAADAAATAGKPAAPTPEQYDQLRQAMRDKLEAAREGGQFDATVAAVPAAGTARPGRPSRAKAAAPAKAKKGNAVYRIAPDGYVAEVFRESAMILALATDDDNKLIVATGNEGQVYAVDPALRETTVLADLDSAQISCAVPTDRGLLLGASNPGALMRMGTAVAEQGGYTSKVLDAAQVSMFGTFKLTADIPQGTTVSIELRSGNVGDPEQGGWTDWSKPALLRHDPGANPLRPIEQKIDIAPARYLQYRLTLTGDGEHTPVIDQTDLAYVAPNTPPTVAKLVLKPAEVKQPGEDPDPKVTIQWQATDENKDRLVFGLEYKPGKADRYLTLAEDLTQPKYDWQTQHVPDGWYTVRLTAYDKLDNPPAAAKSGGRVSEPLLIDNTPPALEGLEAKVLGNGKVKLTAKAADELSAITSVAYSIDGSDSYQASLPEDLIYDSTSEPWGVTISDLSPGGHVISVRVIDARGNTAYRQLIVEVE